MWVPIDGVQVHRGACRQGCGDTRQRKSVHVRTMYRSMSERFAVFFTAACLRAHHSSQSMAARVIFPTGLRK